MGAACSKQTLRHNIKMDLTKIVYEREDWIHVAQDRGQ